MLDVAALLSKVAGFCVRWRWSVVAIWIIMAIGLYLFTSSLPPTTSNEVKLPGTGSQDAYDRMEKDFPPEQNGASPAMYHVTSGKLDDNGKNQDAITQAYKQLKNDPRVYSVTNPFKTKQAHLVSKDGQYAQMPIVLYTNSNTLSVKEATEIYDTATAGPKEAGLEAAVGGPVGNTLFAPDSATSTQIGMIAAAVILLLAFGSIIAMGMPLISAVVGLLLGLSLIWFLAAVVLIPTVATDVATMIGLGVGIDYALFTVSRHRRNVIEKGMDPHLAATHAVATSGGAIIFAGSTVILALVSLTVAGIPFISGLGYAAACGVVGAVLAALTLLPAMLGIVGSGIHRLRIPHFGRSTEHPIAGRWAGFVSRHPVLCAILPLVLVAPLIVPIFTLYLGQPDTAASPLSTSQRQAFDMMTDGFGAGYNGPLAVVVAMDPVAKPSKQYDDLYAQTLALQDELQQEQASLTQQQAELEQQQAELEEQGTQLQAEATQLEAEQATLEAEASQVQKEADALGRQKQQLTDKAQQLKKEEQRLIAEAEDLAKQARALVEQERELLKSLRKQRREGRVLERRIARATDPVIKAALEKVLAKNEKGRKKLREKIKENALALKKVGEQAADLRKQQERLRPQEEQLRKQAEVLAQQGEALARQAAQLIQEGEVLEAEGADLQNQEDQLNAQAAALQQWGDELQQQSDEAKQQQKELTNDSDELKQELITAGGDARGTDPSIAKLQKALATPSQVKKVQPPFINESGNTVILSVIPKSRPAARETAKLVTELREETIPPALSPGMTADVGGSTATNVDLAAIITQKLPLVIVTIIVLSAFLMMLAFRSLLIPLQAAVSNMIAAVASFGVLTAVFQWGWGLEALGIDTSYGTLPVVSYVPLMMFAALFGLSTDYQVFLLSTIQGVADGGAEPREAVREGLMRAAKIVVTAACIMICVFLAFVVNDDPLLKQFGIGLATAVFLAASAVLIFVPALLTLFNKATWWLPKFLDKILPHLDLEGRKMEAKWDADAAAAAEAATATAEAHGPGASPTGG